MRAKSGPTPWATSVFCGTTRTSYRAPSRPVSPCTLSPSRSLDYGRCVSFICLFIVRTSISRQTLPSAVARQQKKIGLATETDPLLAGENLIPGPADVAHKVLPLRELLTRPVCIALLNTGLLSFCEMCNEALLPLVCPSLFPSTSSTLTKENSGVRNTHQNGRSWTRVSCLLENG
jgi:hypothetical protein